jgi:hypothetical protein
MQYLLASVRGKRAGQARAYCQALGYGGAGAFRGQKAGLLLERARLSGKMAPGTFNPFTGASCAGQECRAFSVIECVPKGLKRCVKDAQGNVGNLNIGKKCVGSGNVGRGLLGNCNV